MKRGVVVDIGRIVWLNTLGATSLGQFKTCFASPREAPGPELNFEGNRAWKLANGPIIPHLKATSTCR